MWSIGNVANNKEKTKYNNCSQNLEDKKIGGVLID